MNNEHINYVEFPARDIAKTKEFFSNAFGWKFIDYGENYTALDKATSGLDGGFYTAELTSNSSKGSALVVLYSKNLEESLQKVKDNAGIVTEQIFSFPGGRRFHFTEPSGNELAVWSDN